MRTMLYEYERKAILQRGFCCIRRVIAGEMGRL